MDALNPRRLGPALFVFGALLSLYWLASKGTQQVEPAPLQSDLSVALPNPLEGELLLAISMETGVGLMQVEQALQGGAPQPQVEQALAQRLRDPDPGMALSAVELAIRMGERGSGLARPVLEAGGPGADKALIVLSWTLPPEQARSLMVEQLQGPLAPLAALELARLDPGTRTQAQLQEMRDAADPQDRLILDYAARLASGDPYAELPEGGL